MKALTIKLPEAMLESLQAEARASGKSIASIIRSKLMAQGSGRSGTVGALAGDLAGSVAGSGRPGTNARPKFQRR